MERRLERALGVVLILAGPCAACLVGMRDDMLLLHNWDNNIYSILRSSSNMSLNSLGFAMLTVGTDIVHSLYFDYICSL